jgi:hypothetical protein
MYAEGHTDKMAKHQLNFCADFLRDHGPVATLPAEQAGELPSLPEPATGYIGDSRYFSACQMNDHYRQGYADALAARQAPASSLAQGAGSVDSEHAFKNFHRSLCERFGYTHDEIDWKRDQVSLEEHIAARLARREVEESTRDDVANLLNFLLRDHIKLDDDGRFRCCECNHVADSESDVATDAEHEPDCIVVRARARLARTAAPIVGWRRATKHGWEYRTNAPTASTPGTGWLAMCDASQVAPSEGRAIQICPDADRECGDREIGWCSTCPKRTAVAKTGGAT